MNWSALGVARLSSAPAPGPSGRSPRSQALPDARHLALPRSRQRLVSREVTDTQCGLKAFSRRAAHEIFSRSTLDGFSFDAEVAFLTQRLGLSFQRIPVNLVREYGSTLSAAAAHDPDAPRYRQLVVAQSASRQTTASADGYHAGVETRSFQGSLIMSRGNRHSRFASSGVNAPRCSICRLFPSRTQAACAGDRPSRRRLRHEPGLTEGILRGFDEAR